MNAVNLRVFANDILIELDTRRLNLRRAAAESGVSINTISRLTLHATPPSLENFARLCVWAGLSADGYIGAKVTL